MEMIEEALNKSITSIKIARRTLGIGRNQTYVLEEQHIQIRNDRYEVVQIGNCVAVGNDRQDEDPSMETTNIEVTCVNTSEIKKALRGKTESVDDLLIGLIQAAFDFLIDKLAIFLPNTCKPFPYRNKYVKKCYNDSNSQKRRHQILRPKFLSYDKSIVCSIKTFLTKVLTNRISAKLNSS